MKIPTDLFARRRARSAALSVLPILVLSFAVIAAISFLSQSAYESTATEDRKLEAMRIENALENVSNDFAQTVQREVNLMLATAPERKIDMERMSRHLAVEHNADFIAVYAKSGKLLTVSSSRPEIMERRLAASDELLAKRRELRTEYSIRRIGMSSTILDPKAYIAMAAINVNDVFEVVVTKRLEETVLARVGKDLLLGDLRFGDTQVADITAKETPELDLNWNKTATAALTLGSIAQIGFLGIIVVCLYGLFVFLHVRRITYELETSEAAAQHLAGHDELSGLPNRSVFTRALNRQLATCQVTKQGCAVMYVDLDKFKDVNDKYGHAAGDRLICAVAERLAGLVRGADIVARFGGDEFAIIQTNVKDRTDAEALAARILDILRQPFTIEGNQVQIGASLGISIAPDHAQDGATLMRFADVALYRAKQDGRNRHFVFESELDETAKRKQEIEADLRIAIAEEQLLLHYQPIFSADGESVMGVEALVRWQHPTRGLIPPNEFIGIAEERGLISELGDWVLRRACIEMRAWPTITVAVNVSPVQFRQKDFVSSVAAIIAETGMDPTRLELELTEGVVVDDADQAEKIISELRAMGVRFAIDDFGVGYSSLIYLRRFAFDKIKIDRSFLDSMESTGESAILVHSIVHLGRALGLQVLAEGVETEEQHRFLQAVGCQQLQGYYFARPCRLDALAAKIGDKVIPAKVAA